MVNGNYNSYVNPQILDAIMKKKGQNKTAPDANNSTQNTTTNTSTTSATSYDANASDILATNNKALFGLDKPQKTLGENSLITTLNSYYDTYKDAYSYLFEPQLENFDTAYQSAMDIVNSIWQPPTEPTKEEFSADFNYVLRYQINEHLWNNAQNTVSNDNSVNSRGVNATTGTPKSVSELNGMTITGENGATIVIDTNFMNDGKGNIVCDPADFAPNAKFTITDKNGNESDLFITTEDFDVAKFSETLNQIANVLGEFSDTALKDFQDEIMFLNINKEAIDGVGGSYVNSTNAISLNGNQQITRNILTHELGHAIDNVGSGNACYSQKDEAFFNQIKEALIKFCPDVAETYPMTTIQEFFAEWYVQANYDESDHMSDVIKLLTDKYNEVQNNPKSTDHEKIVAKATIQVFKDFVNQMRENRRDIVSMDITKRLGGNIEYGLNNIAMNTIIEDKNMFKNFYLLSKLGILDGHFGLKHYLMESLAGGKDSVAVNIAMGLMSKGQELAEQGIPIDKLAAVAKDFIAQSDSFFAKASAAGLSAENLKVSTENYKTPSHGGTSEIGNTSSGFGFGFNDVNSTNSSGGNTSGTSGTHKGNSTNTPTLPDIDMSAFDNYFNNSGNNSLDLGSSTITWGSMSGADFGITPTGTKTAGDTNGITWGYTTDQLKDIYNEAKAQLVEQFGANAQIDIKVDSQGNVQYHVLSGLSDSKQDLSSLIPPHQSENTNNKTNTNTHPHLNGLNIDDFRNSDGSIDVNGLYNAWVATGGEAYTYTDNDVSTPWNSLLDAANGGDWNSFFDGLGADSYDGFDDILGDFNVLLAGGGGSSNFYQDMINNSEKERQKDLDKAQYKANGGR